MKVLLDTNAYSSLAAGDAALAESVRRVQAVAFSTIVAGELLHGFRAGSRYQKNLSTLEDFLDQPFVELLPVTFTTAERFARIAAGLRRRGTPIPTNDIWIAAHAMESGAELLSFDAHFRCVEGLAWSQLSH
ncbi:MAG: type II toxin-antitoxin system VapC family toxin [Deltaproteobacteria bacterium]|nr:type II toxin-antitoxin system VapC family toxin [Deltaproteobacteria bacterium]